MEDEYSAEELREAALRFFREEELPEPLWWVEHLDALQQRLFAVEIADALKTALLTESDRELLSVIDGWEATAEVMASPEMLKALTEPVDESEYVSLSEFAESWTPGTPLPEKLPRVLPEE